MCRAVAQTCQVAKCPGGFFALDVSLLKDHVSCLQQPAATCWYHLEEEFLEVVWRLRPDCFCSRRTWPAAGCQRSFYNALPPSLCCFFSTQLAVFWSQEEYFNQRTNQPLVSYSFYPNSLWHKSFPLLIKYLITEKTILHTNRQAPTKPCTTFSTPDLRHLFMLPFFRLVHCIFQLLKRGFFFTAVYEVKKGFVNVHSLDSRQTWEQ